MTDVNDFLNFNVFGAIRAEKNVIFISGTGVLFDGHSVEKFHKVEGDNIVPEIPDGENVVLLFAAYITPNKKATVATRNLTDKKFDLTTNKAVAEAVDELMKKYW